MKEINFFLHLHLPRYNKKKLRIRFFNTRLTLYFFVLFHATLGKFIHRVSIVQHTINKFDVVVKLAKSLGIFHEKCKQWGSVESDVNTVDKNSALKRRVADVLC